MPSEFRDAEPQQFDLLFPADEGLPDEILLLLVAVDGDAVAPPGDLPAGAQVGAAIQFQVNCPAQVAIDILLGAAASLQRRLARERN